MVCVGSNKGTIWFLLTMTVIKGTWRFITYLQSTEIEAAFFFFSRTLCSEHSIVRPCKWDLGVGIITQFLHCKGFMPPCHCYCYFIFLECDHPHPPPIKIPLILSVHFLSVTFPDLLIRIKISFLPPCTEVTSFFSRHLLCYAFYNVHLPLQCGLLEERDHDGSNFGSPLTTTTSALSLDLHLDEFCIVYTFRHVFKIKSGFCLYSWQLIRHQIGHFINVQWSQHCKNLNYFH